MKRNHYSKLFLAVCIGCFLISAASAACDITGTWNWGFGSDNSIKDTLFFSADGSLYEAGTNILKGHWTLTNPSTQSYTLSWLPPVGTTDFLTLSASCNNLDGANNNRLRIFGVRTPPITPTTPTPQITIVAGLHLTVTKHADPYSVKQGQTSIITIQINNDGTTDLHDIEVIDTVPSSLTLLNGNLSNTYDTLNSGESRIYQYMIQTTSAGTFDLGTANVRFADPTGNYQIVTSQAATINVLPTLTVTPTTKSPGFDWAVVIGGLFVLFLVHRKLLF